MLRIPTRASTRPKASKLRPMTGFWLAAGALAALPLLSSCGSTQGVPEFSAPVVDRAGVINDSVEARLNTTLEEFRVSNGPQIAVLVVSSIESQGIEDYSIDVARAWGLGDPTRDDGVLLVIAYEDRKFRIETGSGIEGDLTDVQTNAVMEKMKPALRANDPSLAVDIGVSGIIAEITDETPAADLPGFSQGPAVTPDPVSENPFKQFIPFLIVLFFLVVPAFLASLFGSSRGSSYGGSWWPSSGGFSGGRGGFSGGFSGGFGGGFSGGGSSGSW